MSKEKKNTQNEKRKLSRQERKQIDTLIRQAKGDGKPHTAQDSIPFERMYKDGICRLANGRYSKCIEFEDINYQLAQPDDKTAIFEALCDMYNSFDASISVQLSLISRHANKDDFKNSITIAPQNDDFDSIRAEYTEMLRTQLERGNNGLIKTKFLTFTVEAKDIRSARARLARIETDTLNHFKVIGAAARVLDGKQRLEVLHGIFHPDGERFNFAWEWLPASGLSVKDFIAPSSFRFGDGRMFQMGGKFGVVSFLQIVAPELSDRMLADFMDAENGIIVNLHIQSIDHNEAIKTIKRKITDLDRMKIEEQKKAIRSGYDMDIIPSDLATYGGEAKNLLRDLQSRNERMFLLTLLVLNLADTKQKLDNEVFGAAAIAQKYNCILTRLDYRQEQGLMSSIPLGENLIHIQRGLTTSSTAVFVPFTVQELFQSGEALYYGLNALSNNMILCDRKKLKNPNGLILGTPGSGKSFSAKREITNAFLITADDIIICDPEAEYYPLVGRLKGQVIKVSQNSTQYINPMDINLNYSEGDTPIALKSDFILSFCELIMGGKNGLEAVEKTLIDRAVISVYRNYLADPKPENMPILGDLYDEIKKQPEKEAQRIAAALELYVNGSLNIFNHRTNVDIHNRLVCFDIKELGTQLKKVGMLIVQDQVWNRVTVNRSEGKATRAVKRGIRSHKLKPYRAAAAAEKKAAKANADFLYQKALHDNPALAHSNPISRFWQKQRIKKQYAKALKTGGKVKKTAEATAKAAKKTAQETKRATFFVVRHWKGCLIVGGIAFIVLLFFGGLSSCSLFGGNSGSGLIASSYLSEDADITGAESAYVAMEAELQDMLDNIESEYPGYDEYRVTADEIEHDPYVLISILSAWHEGVFTLDEAQSTLEMLFDKQYILTVTEEVEVRYRTETRTDSEGNEYDVEVAYNYYILNVDLENFNLSHVPVYIMGEEQLSMYAMYMSSLGNRPDLFPQSGYISKYYENPPADYEIPPAYLEDEQFARLIEEAEKYVGFPYVWGGSSPETSFDCSGFVSYVLTNSGLYNTGRLGAQGLYNISTRVSNPQPGDLVFFTGTYDTPGVSHVGIYVGEDGDGSPVMLHCGDPIQYAKLDTSYWQSHFYAYGRLHYN